MSDEVEVGEIPEATKSRTAITRRQGDAMQAYGGAQNFPLADLSDGEFTMLVSRMRTHVDRLRQVKREMMLPGVHYIVPGERDIEKIKAAAEQGKVGISKAGAEFLMKLHNYVGRIEYAIDYGDPKNEETPAITVRSTCHVHAGNVDGPMVGIGVGAATSWEVKYRYRNAQRTCPACQKPALIFQREAKGGEYRGRSAYWCAPFKEGCGANFAGDDPTIAGQEAGKITNGDPFDLLNTLVKMSAKRAKVDGAITATGSSDLFVQDVEDVPRHEQERLRREIDEGADATVGEMYGPAGGDPNDWRNEPEAGTTRPAAGAAPASAPSAASSAPARTGSAKPATDRQKAALRALLRAKLGASGDVAQEQALIETMHVAEGFSGITVADASTAIDALNKMPDAPKGEAPAAAAPVSRAAALTESPTASAPPAAAPAQASPVERDSDGMPKDTTANREYYQRRIREMVEKLEAGATRKIMSNEDGILYLVGSNEMALLKLRGPVALEHLEVAALFKLGGYLKSELERTVSA